MTPWRAVARELRHYKSAVLAARDREGYPVSVRCVPVPDEPTGTFRVSLPDGLGTVAGPAWLLCHFHDERYWSLRSFGSRGSLERSSEGWRFTPVTFVPGMGGVMPWVRLMFGGRTRAMRYLAVRHLTPPAPPWDRINGIKHQMKLERTTARVRQ